MLALCFSFKFFFSKKNPACNRWLILHWQVGAEIPMDSKEAEDDNTQASGKTLLYVLERGC